MASMTTNTNEIDYLFVDAMAGQELLFYTLREPKSYGVDHFDFNFQAREI